MQNQRKTTQQYIVKRYKSETMSVEELEESARKEKGWESIYRLNYLDRYVAGWMLFSPNSPDNFPGGEDVQLNFEEEHEVFVLHGVETDTGDLFGQPVGVTLNSSNPVLVLEQEELKSKLSSVVPKFVGLATCLVPMHASKPFTNQARYRQDLGRKIPGLTSLKINSVHLLSVEKLAASEVIEKIKSDHQRFEIDVTEEYLKLWQHVLSQSNFFVSKLNMKTQGLVLLRSFVSQLGNDIAVPSCIFSQIQTSVHVKQE